MDRYGNGVTLKSLEKLLLPCIPSQKNIFESNYSCYIELDFEFDTLCICVSLQNTAFSWN